MEPSQEMSIGHIEYRADSADTPSPTGLFLHGLLVGEGVRRPAFQCAPLVRELVTLGCISFVMPEFHRLFGQRHNEPNTLDPGPVTGPVLQEIERLTDPDTCVTVVAYSYGAVILSKLLRTPLAGRVGKIGLIAPVVGWIQDSWMGALSTLPTIVICGTHDKFARQEDVVKRWFPNAQFCTIDGANHLYYLASSPMDSRDEQVGIITREEQISRTAQNVIAYLGIRPRVMPSSCFQIIEVTSTGDRDLTGEF